MTGYHAKWQSTFGAMLIMSKVLLILNNNNTQVTIINIKPAAFDVTVTSPLTPATLHDACNSAGVAAHKAECRKHSSDDPKCQELGWVCVPLAVESYGNWGKEAENTFARLASILLISLHYPKAKVLTEIYGRLNISLVRSVARAIMSRRCVPG